MAVEEMVEISDRESIIGPHKHTQVIQAWGLISPWKHNSLK